MPVGKWKIATIWTAVGVEVVVFCAADAADLEVADVDVGDVCLAGGSGVGRFGHGVDWPNERGSVSALAKSSSFG